MADNSPLGTMLMAGGGLAATGKQDALCKAFAAAVKDWCANKKDTQNREFADVFYKKLRGKGGDKDLAKAITREAPVLTKMKGTAEAVVGALSDVFAGVAGNARERGIARRINRSARNLPASGTRAVQAGWGGQFRRRLNNSLSTGAGSRYGFRFPDGRLPDGQLLEIKGPGDKFGEGQAEAYEAESKRASGKSVAVVSCEACKAANCPENKRCR